MKMEVRDGPVFDVVRHDQTFLEMVFSEGLYMCLDLSVLAV